jgi:hypothetical protein
MAAKRIDVAGLKPIVGTTYPRRSTSLAARESASASATPPV